MVPGASSNSVVILGQLASVYHSLRPVHLLFHFAIHLLPLPLGVWVSLAWPGRHPRGHALLGLLAGLVEALTILLMVNVARIVGAPIKLLTEDELGLLATVALFTAGGLFGDLAENRGAPTTRSEAPGQDEHTSQEGTERTLVLIQSLGPAVLALLGTIITAAVYPHASALKLSERTSENSRYAKFARYYPFLSPKSSSTLSAPWNGCRSYR
jgi:hypothetical protein